MTDLFQAIARYQGRPRIDAPSTSAFWDDAHISKGMMAAHLDPDRASASRPHAFIDASAAWISTVAPPDAYPRLLDLGCGPGLYAERFARLGYETFGVDLSARAVDYARRSAERHGLSIEYARGDYLDWTFSERVDLATLIYGDFGVLSRRARCELLGRVFEWLRPGGRLILDVFTFERHRGRPESRTWSFAPSGFWRDGPHLCLNAFYRFDEDAAFLEQFIVADEASTACYRIWDHVFTPTSLRDELVEAGFDRVEWFGDVAGRPYEPESETICAVATRR